MNRILIESLLFAGLCCLATLGNVLFNPSALSLSVNYAPAAVDEHEFNTIDAAEIVSYLGFLREENAYAVVIDARSIAEHEISHIPGSYAVDHYNQQQLVEPLLDVILAAPIVVVYCKGGDCQDSIFLARDLVYKYNVAFESIYIYEGGMNDWLQNSHPIATGLTE
ncbi:MAG: hypothetical protein H8E25_10080 [Planctomycetes bacterium]|nr:hypothetical protein [Planctomycetota bacterium]